MVPYMIPLVKKFVFSLLFSVYWQPGASAREKPLFSESTSYSLFSLDQATHFLLAVWNTRRSCEKQIGARTRKMRSYDNNSLSFVHEKHCSAMPMAEYLCWLHVISVHK